MSARFRTTTISKCTIPASQEDSDVEQVSDVLDLPFGQGKKYLSSTGRVANKIVAGGN